MIRIEDLYSRAQTPASAVEELQYYSFPLYDDGLLTTSRDVVIDAESLVSEVRLPQTTETPDIRVNIDVQPQIMGTLVDPENLSTLFSIFRKIRNEWNQHWENRTGIQKGKKPIYIVSNFLVCYIFGCFSVLAMLGFVTAGVVTTKKSVSIAVLVGTGIFWFVASLCLSFANLEKDDNWGSISSRFWRYVTALFAVGGGLVFGKWIATHK